MVSLTWDSTGFHLLGRDTKVLIIDELGYLPMSREAAGLFFPFAHKALREGQSHNHLQQELRELGREIRRPGTGHGDTGYRLLHHSTVLKIKGEEPQAERETQGRAPWWSHVKGYTHPLTSSTLADDFEVCTL